VFKRPLDTLIDDWVSDVSSVEVPMGARSLKLLKVYLKKLCSYTASLKRSSSSHHIKVKVGQTTRPHVVALRGSGSKVLSGTIPVDLLVDLLFILTKSGHYYSMGWVCGKSSPHQGVD
jgi:hypothetical protein